MRKKKWSAIKYIEIVIIILLMILAIIIDKKIGLYSSQGIVFSTLSVAFVMIICDVIALRSFIHSFHSIDEKVISVIMVVLLLVTSGIIIFLQYNYTSIGKQAAEAEHIADAATEVNEANASELRHAAWNQWEQASEREIAFYITVMLYCLFFLLVCIWGSNGSEEKKANRDEIS